MHETELRSIQLINGKYWTLIKNFKKLDIAKKGKL